MAATNLIKAILFGPLFQLHVSFDLAKLLVEQNRRQARLQSTELRSIIFPSMLVIEEDDIALAVRPRFSKRSSTPFPHLMDDG